MSKNNENKLVPRLRFPEFRNEEGWEMKKVGEVIEESKVPSTSNNPHNRITVRLNQKGVEKREVRGTEADNATYFFIRRKGQFIYGKQNLHKGAFGLIPDELDGFESSQDIPAFDFKNGYYPQYFVYYLGQENVYPDLEKISTGTGSKRIHPRDLFQVKFPFPKTEEQQKIAACLSSLDDVITAESKKLEVLKEHKKGLLQNLFPQEGETVPKLRFKEFEDSGEWVFDAFSEYIKLYRGSSPRPIQNYFTTDESGANWIKIGDTKNADNFLIKQVEERITPEGAKKSRKVEVGELILANSMSFGKTYQLAIEGYIYDGWFVLREYEKQFDKEFLLQLLNSDYMQNQYKKLSTGGIVQNISSDIVYNTVLPHTSVYEQKRIAACLSSLDEIISAQSQKIETLKLHKKGLLQGLFPDINEHNG